MKSSLILSLLYTICSLESVSAGLKKKLVRSKLKLPNPPTLAFYARSPALHPPNMEVPDCKSTDECCNNNFDTFIGYVADYEEENRRWYQKSKEHLREPIESCGVDQWPGNRLDQVRYNCFDNRRDTEWAYRGLKDELVTESWPFSCDEGEMVEVYEDPNDFFEPDLCLQRKARCVPASAYRAQVVHVQQANDVSVDEEFVKLSMDHANLYSWMSAADNQP